MTTDCLTEFEGREDNGTGFNRLDLKSVLAANALPSRMLIPEILPAGEVGMLVGEPGSSKTEFALKVAVALARGETFMVGEEVEPHHVVYVAMEGSSQSIGDRIRRLSKSMGSAEESDISDVISHYLHVISPSGQQLDGPAVPMAGILEYVGRMTEAGNNPVLVIVDTLAFVITGDENSAESARELWSYANHIREVSGGSVLFVHHLGKPAFNKPGQPSRGTLHAIRGTSAHHGAARFVLGLSVKQVRTKSEPMGWNPFNRNGLQGDLLELKVLKRNDGPEGYELLFERDPDTGSLSPYDPMENGSTQQISLPPRMKQTKTEKVMQIYQDPELDDKGKRERALILFKSSSDPEGSLRSALRRLRDLGKEV